MMRCATWAGCCLSGVVPAMAQPAAGAQAAPPSSVGAYAIVGLALVLGMFVVCHPSYRTKWRSLRDDDWEG